MTRTENVLPTPSGPGEDAARYFVPAYLGSKGWVGVYLDVDRIDWARVEELVAEAFRLTAPKRLASRVG